MHCSLESCAVWWQRRPGGSLDRWIDQPLDHWTCQLEDWTNRGVGVDSDQLGHLELYRRRGYGIVHTLMASLCVVQEGAVQRGAVCVYCTFRTVPLYCICLYDCLCICAFAFAFTFAGVQAAATEENDGIADDVRCIFEVCVCG